MFYLILNKKNNTLDFDIRDLHDYEYLEEFNESKLTENDCVLLLGNTNSYNFDCTKKFINNILKLKILSIALVTDDLEELTLDLKIPIFNDSKKILNFINSLKNIDDNNSFIRVNYSDLKKYFSNKKQIFYYSALLEKSTEKLEKKLSTFINSKNKIQNISELFFLFEFNNREKNFYSLSDLLNFIERIRGNFNHNLNNIMLSDIYNDKFQNKISLFVA